MRERRRHLPAPPRQAMRMAALGAVLAAAALAAVALHSARQSPSLDGLRELTGSYRWESGRFVELHLWSELTGKDQLVAIDDDGEVRALSASGADRFTAGPSAGVATPVESRLEFHRDDRGAVAAVSWQRGYAPPRRAQRAAVERSEAVSFSSGDLQLSGTLALPVASPRQPALVLVHGSGAATRDQVLPLARFLVRHGIAILAYDKRGAGHSAGDWATASFDDLAGDALAAVAYLRTRSDIDPQRIGLFGWSQAGWVMPLAAVRDPALAAIVSLSGAGVTPAETTLDQAGNEMTARGMKPQAVQQIVGLMQRQYEFARTGSGWDEYTAARAALTRLMGAPPDSFPGTRDHPQWAIIRRLYLHDPEPVLRRLRTPVLALFGERDNNILAEKNAAAWKAALAAGGHPDYTLRVMPNANHGYFEANTGANVEMPSLRRFVPEYRTTLVAWLGPRLKASGGVR